MELMGKQKDFVSLVEAGESYILVEAPAGTGKTFCCIQAARIIWNNRMISDYQKVLVLTFSRNARAQIMRELMNTPEEEGLTRHIDINNYHSFFKKYLDAYRDLIGIGQPLTVLDNESFDEAFALYSTENNISFPVSLGCEFLDDFCMEGCAIKCVNPQSAYRKEKIVDIQKYYNAAYKFSQLSGNIAFSQFGNLICNALMLSSHMTKAISHDYPVLILDEYQDTNHFQEIFVQAIADSSKCIFFADSMQMIYGFRGSSESRVRDLYVRYPSIKRVEFDEFHRYKDKPDLVAILTAIRQKRPINYSILQNGKFLSCSIACDSDWEKKKGSSRAAQCTIFCKGLYYKIIRDVTSLLRSKKSVAILCRTNNIADRLTEVFFENNLHPKSVSDTADLMQLSKLLKKAIIKGNCISEKIPLILGVAALCTMNKRIADEGYEELLMTSVQSLSRKRKPLLKEIYSIILPVLSSAALDDLCSVITKILEFLGSKEDVLINYPRRRFVEHCMDCKELSAQTVDNIMLQRQYISSFTTINPGLYITTMHQSKGKEFDCVYVVDAGALASDHNLLYVSHSRMKEKLFPIIIQYTGVGYR